MENVSGGCKCSDFVKQKLKIRSKLVSEYALCYHVLQSMSAPKPPQIDSFALCLLNRHILSQLLQCKL